MAVDRGIIDAQLREIGESDRWWEQREFRDLHYVLQPDEQIRGLVRGALLGRRRPRVMPHARWLIVATTQRLICLRQERFARKQVEIPAQQITRVVGRARLRAYQLLVETPRGSFRLRIPTAEAARFTAALQPLTSTPAAPALEPDTAPRPAFPGLGPLAALPGVATIVAKVSRRSPADAATQADVERLEFAVERLQGEVRSLRQQVSFLERLLHGQTDQTALHHPADATAIHHPADQTALHHPADQTALHR